MTAKRPLVTAGGVLLGLLALFSVAPPAQAQTISTANSGQAETEAGNIVADAVRAAGGADIAFVPAGALKRSAEAPSPATPAQATALLDRADETVVVLNLRGAVLLSALERSVSFAPQRSDGFLQVSGLRFVYNPREAGGKRVSSVTMGGNAVDIAKTYKVAMTATLANGSYGYFRIWDKNDIATETQKTLAEALRSLATAHGGSLSAPVEGRITARGG